MADPTPTYTTPAVNPAETAREALNSSQGISTPKFSYAQNPTTEHTRVHGDLTQHPENKQFTRQPRGPKL